MLVWSILFGGILLHGVAAGVTDLNVQNQTVQATQCHNYRITRLSNGSAIEPPATIETCKPGIGCLYREYWSPKEYIETAECDLGIRGDKNGIWTANYGEEDNFFEFFCDSDLCNTKESLIHQQAQEIHELSKVKWEILNQEHKKQGNETLFCYEKKFLSEDLASSVNCSGYCSQERNFPFDSHLDKQMCRELSYVYPDPGRSSIQVEAFFGKGELRIDTYSACLYNNCNGEESVNTKFHDEVYNILGEYEKASPAISVPTIEVPAPSEPSIEVIGPSQPSIPTIEVSPPLVLPSHNTEVSADSRKPIHLKLDLLIYV